MGITSKATKSYDRQHNHTSFVYHEPMCDKTACIEKKSEREKERKLPIGITKSARKFSNIRILSWLLNNFRGKTRVESWPKLAPRRARRAEKLFSSLRPAHSFFLSFSSFCSRALILGCGHSRDDTQQWKKLSARTMIRPVGRYRRSGRCSLCMHVFVRVRTTLVCGRVRWWRYKGRERVYKHSVTGRRERSDCLEWRFLPRISAWSRLPLCLRALTWP